jgi:hypothetical protein
MAKSETISKLAEIQRSYLGMSLNPSSLLPNTRLVQLRRHNLQQINRIIDARRREAFYLLRLVGFGIGGLWADPTASGNRPWPSRLAVLARLGLLGNGGLGLFRGDGRLFFGEEACVLGFAREVGLALLLLVFSFSLAAFQFLVGPFVGLFLFLREEGVSLKRIVASKH